MRNECPRLGHKRKTPQELDIYGNCSLHGYIPLLERPPTWGTINFPRGNPKDSKKG